MNAAAEPLLGRDEGPQLEFKSREALEDLAKVGREVVGMLNAEGGEVWVGVREEAGRAVAVEALADPGLARQRLRDYLADSLEPRLQAEVAVEVVEWQGSPALLRIEIRPRRERQP
jgi:predicted HTH transcriptional regulator